MNQIQLDALARKEWKANRRTIKAMLVYMVLGIGVWSILIYYATKIIRTFF